MLQVNKEISEKFEAAKPFIAFFALSKSEQIIVLPTLEERKYDFTEGDLISSNALEILICSYISLFNAIAIRFLIVEEERSRTLEDVHNLVGEIHALAIEIFEESFEAIGNIDSLEAPEWNTIRVLSSTLQEKTNMFMAVDREIIKKCIEDWLHP